MLIEVRGLKLDLQGHPILHNVSLSLDRGQIYGLLGPNGAGKSTTISVIVGLRAPKEGFVRVLGLNPVIDQRPLHRRIGAVAEDSGFYDWMNAQNYLRWVASLYGVSLRSEEIPHLLDQVGLDAKNLAPIAAYSRGMRQRLSLARALINKPELLILDEPTNGLDPRGRREIHDVLLELSAQQGVGILLCTHLLDDVDRLCTRIGIIAQGKTLLEGSIADILSTQQSALRFRVRVAGEVPAALPPGIVLVARSGEWCHLRLAGGSEPARCWRTLLDAGWRIEEIHQEGGGLEDLYLSVTEAGEAKS